jgi:hypothetical protein
MYIISSVVQHLFCICAAAVAMLCPIIIAALHPVLHPHSVTSGPNLYSEEAVQRK